MGDFEVGKMGTYNEAIMDFQWGVSLQYLFF